MQDRFLKENTEIINLSSSIHPNRDSYLDSQSDPLNQNLYNIETENVKDLNIEDVDYYEKLQNFKIVDENIDPGLRTYSKRSVGVNNTFQNPCNRKIEGYIKEIERLSNSNKNLQAAVLQMV